jgi:hypothetical protein
MVAARLLADTIITATSKLVAKKHTAAQPLGNASVDGEGRADANLFIIRPVRTKHGTRRNWRRREWAQRAIAALYPDGTVPKDVGGKKLARKVNVWLQKNNEFCNTKIDNIDRMTVLRALADFKKANAVVGNFY